MNPRVGNVSLAFVGEGSGAACIPNPRLALVDFANDGGMRCGPALVADEVGIAGEAVGVKVHGNEEMGNGMLLDFGAVGGAIQKGVVGLH